MVSLFLFLTYFILEHSIKPITTPTKFCINCKYFIPGQNSNKCAYFKNTGEDDMFLITGVSIDKQISCDIARKMYSLCGPHARYYRNKYPKKYIDV